MTVISSCLDDIDSSTPGTYRESNTFDRKCLTIYLCLSHAKLQSGVLLPTWTFPALYRVFLCYCPAKKNKPRAKTLHFKHCQWGKSDCSNEPLTFCIASRPDYHSNASADLLKCCRGSASRDPAAILVGSACFSRPAQLNLGGFYSTKNVPAVGQHPTSSNNHN